MEICLTMIADMEYDFFVHEISNKAYICLLMLTKKVGFVYINQQQSGGSFANFPNQFQLSDTENLVSIGNMVQIQFNYMVDPKNVILILCI